ncbi:MAG: hypothetical protein V3V51_07360 [Desulfobacterales bacterium]
MNWPFRSNKCGKSVSKCSKENIRFLEKIIAEETHHIRELRTLMNRNAAEEKIASETYVG